MKRRRSIKQKFLIIYAVSFFLPIVISTFIISTYLKVQFTNQIKDLIDYHLKSTTQRIVTYLDDLNMLTTLPYYDSEFMGYLNRISKENKHENIMTYERFLVDKMFKDKLSKYMALTRREIISAVFIRDNSIVFGVRNNGTNVSVNNYDFSKTSWYKGAENSKGKAYVTGIHSQDYFLDYKDTMAFSIARELIYPETGKKLGVIMADADTRVLEDIFSNINFNISSKVALLDESNNIIFSTGDVTNEYIDKMRLGDTVKVAKESYIVKIENLEDYNWKMAMFVSNSSINNKLKGIYVVCILLLIMGLAITFFIFNILSRDITIPVKNIIEVMKEVERSNFNVRVGDLKIYEINELGYSLNNMIKKLNESIEKEYKLVIQQKDAEFKVLQSQISPHFLYNTLNGFIGLNRIGEKQLLEKSIINLTRILRFSLDKRNVVTIKEEFDNLEKYGKLQLMRFEDRMKVNLSYDKEIKDYLIPKFLLQPVVENAIIHGIEPSDKYCTLDIIAELDGTNIIFTVKDDGVGCDIITFSEGVGVSNTKNRLLLFNKNSEFYINSSLNEGTYVKIVIPREELKSENSYCR